MAASADGPLGSPPPAPLPPHSATAAAAAADVFPVATSDGNVPDPAHVTSDGDAPDPAHVTSDGDAPAPAPFTSKLIDTIKGVDKRVKFDIGKAEILVNNNEFGKLEAYVLEVLAFAQGGGQHYQHPGIQWSIYRAHMAYLIRDGRADAAASVLNDKVKPLLSSDMFYMPQCLTDQVSEAEESLNSVVLQGDTDLLSLIFDYIDIHFPSLLTPERERSATVYDFVAQRMVHGGKEVRCKVCQWVFPPHSQGEVKLGRHYTGHPKVKRCFYVSEWILSYLKTIKMTGGAALVRGKSVPRATAKASGGTPQKRKNRDAVSLPQPDGNFTIPNELMDGLAELHASIVKVPRFLLQEDEENALVAADQVREVMAILQSVTCDLISMAYKNQIAYAFLDPAAAVTKFNMLGVTSQKLWKPILYLQNSKTIVQEVFLKAGEVGVKSSDLQGATGLKKKSSGQKKKRSSVSVVSSALDGTSAGTGTDATEGGNTGSAAGTDATEGGNTGSAATPTS